MGVIELSEFKKFEDIKAWERAHNLCVSVYRALEKSREYDFRGHIFKTALSIPSNIAEGFERHSSREFVQFLNYAKGSCGELRAQLYVAKDLDLVESEQVCKMILEVKEISSMISGLVRSVRKRMVSGQTKNANRI